MRACNCEHAIVQRVVLQFFPVQFEQTIPNKHKKDCRNYVCNISETFQETITQEYVGRKSTCQGLIYSEILHLCVLSHSPPE